MRIIRRKRRGDRGATLIESLLAALISLFIGAAVVAMMQTSYTARGSILGESNALTDTRRALDTLSNRLRNAQMVPATGAFSAASSNSITCYNDAAGATTTRYWLDTTSSPGSLKQTDSTGTATLMSDVQSLQFTYYVSSAANFTGPSATWTTTTLPNAPTAAERPNLGALGVTVTIHSGVFSRTLSTFIRLRNSPAKPHI